MENEILVTNDTIKKRVETDEIEIRLDYIIDFIKKSRWIILKWITAFLVIGGIYAFSLPNQFTATVRVMPELKTQGGAGGMGDLKSLAGLAGVNLDNLSGTSEAIRPDLYPDIVQSLPFRLHLLKQPIRVKDGQKPELLQAYLRDQHKNNILNRIAALFGNEEEEPQTTQSNEPEIRLTKLQETLSKKVGENVSAAIDKKSGIVTITAQMPDPLVAAIVAKQTLDYLTNYVTDYRTGKSRKQVQFLTQQVNNARQRYQGAEYAVSSYRDRSRNLFLETAKIEEQRLQSDYLLAQTVYNDLSKQLEQAKIKVQEEAPVFQVLEPAQVPLKKSGPKRLLIVIGFIIIGVIAGLTFSIFYKWRTER